MASLTLWQRQGCEHDPLTSSAETLWWYRALFARKAVMRMIRCVMPDQIVSLLQRLLLHRPPVPM